MYHEAWLGNLSKQHDALLKMNKSETKTEELCHT